MLPKCIHLRFKNYIVFCFILLLSKEIVAQQITNQTVSLEEKVYHLVNLLETLSNQGVPVAFSASKLQNKKVNIRGAFTVKSLLEYLKSEKLIDYQIIQSSIIINAYQPKKWVLSGNIKDQETGEDIIGATIQVGNSYVGTISNGYGYFALSLDEGIYTLNISHVQYKNHQVTLDLNAKSHLAVKLQQSFTELGEVIVVNDDSLKTEHSNIDLPKSINSIENISMKGKEANVPYFLGEVDVIRNLLLRTGINTLAENSAGLYIRGGQLDQNLYLLDEAPIYNPNHLVGLVSVFNPDAVNNVRVMKGFAPVSYGGRSSGVIEVRQKEGNLNKTSFAGGISLMSLRGLIETPFVNKKGSILLSGRQGIFSLVDVGSGSADVDSNYSDLNLKVNYRKNEKNAFYLSGYWGNDFLNNNKNIGNKWGNKLLTMRWNHLFSPKVFTNFTSYISDYTHKSIYAKDPVNFTIRSNIVNYALKSNTTFYRLPEDEIKFGVSLEAYRLNPAIQVFTRPFQSVNALGNESAFTPSFYVSRELQKKNFSIYTGFRYNIFYNYGSKGILSDLRRYRDGRILKQSEILPKFYHSLSPRIAIDWKLARFHVKLSYNKSVQYLHLISNAVTTSPNDIWRLSNDYIPPTASHQYTLGIQFPFNKNRWEFSGDFYYKDIVNRLSLKKGISIFFRNDFRNDLQTGIGRAYGMELNARKKVGRLTGWFGYSLSRTESKYGAKGYELDGYDKTHNISTTWNYQLNKRVNFSANFVYSTGVPIRLPSDKYFINGYLIPHFNQNQQFRIPDYHRLDFAMNLSFKEFRKNGKKRKMKGAWTFMLYNLYARQNAQKYILRGTPSQSSLGEVVKSSLFGFVIPGVAYNFRF